MRCRRLRNAVSKKTFCSFTLHVRGVEDLGMRYQRKHSVRLICMYEASLSLILQAHPPSHPPTRPPILFNYRPIILPYSGLSSNQFTSNTGQSLHSLVSVMGTWLTLRWNYWCFQHKSLVPPRSTNATHFLHYKQENIPIGCVTPAWTETPWTENPHRTENSQTETSLDRDPLPGQRPPWQRPPYRDPHTGTPWTETPLDRDPSGQRPPRQRTPLDRNPPLRGSPLWTESQTSGGSKGRHKGHTCPWVSKCFQFHAIFGNIWQNRMFAHPPLRVGAPPRENPLSATAYRCKNITFPRFRVVIIKSPSHQFD